MDPKNLSPLFPLIDEVGRMSARRKVVFAGDGRRMFGSEPPGSSGSRPAVSVVGIPDPITWIRCKVIMYLIELYFEIDLNSEEFNRGIKQVNITKHHRGHRSHFIIEINTQITVLDKAYVEQKCKSLSAAQRRQLSVQIDDIIFLLPEDVSVVFDQYGRKFCFVVMRFWMLSSHEGPDDPEGTKIFKVTSSDADERWTHLTWAGLFVCSERLIDHELAPCFCQSTCFKYEAF
uniref:Uncharacterized protein n=1 Tax=Gouania willdenowi TaxID=441366 RepID=A0A8C5EHW0_GOUWI